MNSEQIFNLMSDAVEENPHDYSYLMGLLYADGIGCVPDFRLAIKYLEDAHSFGDKRAAFAVAHLYADRLRLPDLADWERDLCHTQLTNWTQLAVKEL